jgi:O-antigen ligase
MANTINIPKTHLIMGLSLPLAVLIGYFLAEPLELGSVAVVTGVLGVLCIPLLLRWYYPMLVFCWNAALNPAILPGRPSMAAIMGLVGLGIAILTRAVNPKARFISVPSLTRPMLVLAAVVITTGLLTGGFGVRTLGSEHYGGSKYFGLLTAIAGYFVLTSQRIPSSRAGLYIALFFLSGITCLGSELAIALGPKFYFLLSIFSGDYATQELASQQAVNASLHRMGALCAVASAIDLYLLARFGLRGVLDLQRPWRLLLFLAALVLGLYGGFRSYVALLALTFIVLFFVEGLHRTRYLPALMAAALVAGAIILPQGNKLPMAAQRALSFLPGRFDPIAVENAAATLEWRLIMWRQVWPEVPAHLFRGKGYALDPTDLFLAGESGRRFSSEALSGTIIAGDYHNGPLSILLPFGIYGMIAFLWLLLAGMRVMYRNYKFGTPDYRSVNALILAAFAAHAFYFFTGFGSLFSDMAFFAGMLGMSVALNGAEPSLLPQAEKPDVEAALNTEYIRA